MKNIIPFKKEVIFKTNLSEVTSISLEHTLTLNDNNIKGNFIINGEYKINDKSVTVDPFNLELPFEIMIDEKYDTSKAILDIDDFYYEIINDNILSISIDVLIDKLEEKLIEDNFDLVDVMSVRDIIEPEQDDIKEESIEIKPSDNNVQKYDTIQERCIDESEKEEFVKKAEENKKMKLEEAQIERKVENKEVEEKIGSLFNQISKDSEVFVTYNVFIIREGDTIDSILDKYNITLEELKKYNDVDNLKLGDKLIIPNTDERN